MNALASLVFLQLALLLAQPAAAPMAGTDPARDLGDFPKQIWVQSALRETVAHMWATSPTFRRQCLQVKAAGQIQVQIRIDPLLASDTRHNATCELTTYTSGAIIARISVAPARLPELIGHEMEHVCERLEGIKVQNEARAGVAGYYEIKDWQSRYESDRAVRVGRQVFAEVNVSDVMTRRQ
jgi:hypothetical protein